MNRGLTLIEVLFSAGMLSLVLLGVTHGLRRSADDLENLSITKSIHEVEGTVSIAATKAIWQYILNRSLPANNCVSKLPAYLAALAVAPSGMMNLTPVSPPPGSASAVFSGSGPEAQTALTRCRNQSLIPASIDIKARSSFYFCLYINPIAGAVTPYKMALSNQPFFGEFTFDLRSNAGPVVTCAGYQANSTKLIGSLAYTLYWTSRSSRQPTFRKKSGFVSYGQIPQ